MVQANVKSVSEEVAQTSAEQLLRIQDALSEAVAMSVTLYGADAHRQLLTEIDTLLAAHHG